MNEMAELEKNSMYAEKLNALKGQLSGKQVVVAFSGGRDSALLAYLAKQYGAKVLAVFMESELSPSVEHAQAQDFCARYQIPLRITPLSTLKLQMIRQNHAQRCYYCKQLILQNLEDLAKEEGFDMVVDGTNYSDLKLPRAGLQALKESRVTSPFALAQITKKDIIELSRLLGLISQNFTSQACLASRIPFDVPITQEMLTMIDHSEAYLRGLLPNTHSPFRVRLHKLLPTDQYLARIEAGPELFELLNHADKRAEMAQELRNLGFTYVTFDIEGFQSGSMHRMLL
jgi:pyridinium-3,5-biscarboxylic acid mononucleotide sulfurtransferase